MDGLPFTKMHGLGNDFVVIDARPGRPGAAAVIDDPRAAAIADRRTGVGCDQLILIEAPANGTADAFMRIRNADGGEVEACGNATRCVGARLLAETGKPSVVIETTADLLTVSAGDDGRVTVDMGEPRFGWQDIPLAREQDTLHLDLARWTLSDPAAASMGNPHATFFVDDADSVDLARLGPDLEHDPLFPERANIALAEMQGDDRMRLRVWERGAGITLACGTGACAAAANAHRRGLAGRRVTAVMDGGELLIEWRENGHIFMTGPAATSFDGVIAPSLLA